MFPRPVSASDETCRSNPLLSTTITARQASVVLERADCLHTATATEAALDRMAVDITRHLAAVDPILVCIMTGGVVPFGRLLPRLSFPLQVDFVHATRYRGNLKGGELHWRTGPALDPRGRTVLLVDDILDEGTTLAAIEAHYRDAGAAQVLKAVLAIKDRARARDVAIDFAGVRVPNRYVFGYGMDYKGYLRNAPGIYAERETL